MKEIFVGIGDIKVSNKPGAIIKTFSLGSCIAVIAYAPAQKVSGMVNAAPAS